MSEEKKVEKESREFLPAEVVKMNPVEMFNPENREKIIEHVKTKAFALEADLTTQKGRDAVKSHAYQVSRSKTFIDDIGASAVKERKEEIKAFDKSRKILKDTFDSIRDEVRKPLNDYEEAEKARVDAVQEKLKNIAGLDTFESQLGITAELIQVRLDQAKEIVVNDDFDEYKDMAQLQLTEKISILTVMVEQKQKYEDDQAELAELRKGKEEQARKDAEEAEKKEREEREEAIRVEAAEEAKKEVEAAKQRAIEAEEKAETDRLEAERLAEVARIQNEKRAEAERIDAEEKRKELMIQAEKDVAFAKEAARGEEKARQEAWARAEREEADKRAADEEHRKKINAEAVSGLIKLRGIDGPIAIDLIMAINTGEIPNITINY